MNFTHDFVTKNAANWECWLGQFRGLPHTALEIGSFEGRSAIWFIEHILIHPDSRLICVDTFQWLDARSRFDANTIEAGVAGKLEVIQEASEWLTLPPELRLSWAYIDGNHTAPHVLIDAVLTWRSLARGGVVIFDDYLYLLNGAQPIQVAVDAWRSVMGADVEVIARDGNQICLRKTA